MLINFKFCYRDGSGKEEQIQREVDYIPDTIVYKDYDWKKESSSYDFDTGEYTKIYYSQITKGGK